ncbi:MAG: pilus assembly protein PilB [Gammaproteobacteria bacterium]|nr:MAG: pilus assembly protein PilB [Gammaproteobacteria bacterium]
MALTDEQLIEAGVRTGLIEANQLERLKKDARRQRSPILPMILAHYRFPSTALYRAMAENKGIRFIDLNGRKAHAESLKKVPASLIKRKQLLPIIEGDNVLLVVSDPNDRGTIDTVQRLLGKQLELVMADVALLNLQLERLFANTSKETEVVDETDLVTLLDSIIREAYLNQASDIHFVTEEEGLRVRLRVDGRLRDYPVVADAAVAAGLVSRVKVLSGLDIAEQRQPQDGGFSYHLAAPIDVEFNVRVATAPTRLGERITMRLLGQDSGGITLTDLGMLPKDLERFKVAIEKPYGLILLTGPTGSGKSTTLFAALQEINDPEINIMTVENPIEYVMDGVSQIQIGHKISFADALRSLLRHDPDVLMVGEIRDHETADVAVKAAMTGHMVFSTLHTNNAVSAVTRLIDIGCEAFLIGSTLTAVIAQRLVRRLCIHCRKPHTATPAECELLGVADPVEIYDAVGCAVCQGRGYRGRLGVFETLWFDEHLSRLVAQGGSEDEIEATAGNNLQFMWEDGSQKVLNGMTSLAELQAVAMHKTHDMMRHT